MGSQLHIELDIQPPPIQTIPDFQDLFPPPPPPPTSIPIPNLIDEEVICAYSLANQSAGKPQVWIRLRPPPKYDDNVFEIEQDGKSLRVLLESEDRLMRRMKSKRQTGERSKGLKFSSDGILQSSSQDDTYRQIVNEVVDKAMNGVNGAIISLGPEVSGKSFTLFGHFRKFEYRGVIPRALERIFQLIDAKCLEINYVIRIGIIEVRRNRIRDLLTLGPYELQHVGENGPYGMLLQQIGCAEHGLGLLIRALTGQKNIPRESFARYHTVVYIDIQGEAFLETQPRVIKSRLTFAKLASMPRRSKSYVRGAQVTPFDGFMEADGCVYARPTNPSKQSKDPPKYINTCCKAKSGPMAEAIGVRQDLSFLEQMFIRANELRKLNKYYDWLKRMGMSMLMKPPKPDHSRQSKLAHCLQDIVSGSTEIRIILHIRPERQYLNTTLEAIRFAERAKCVPFNLVVGQEHEETNIEMLKNEISILRDELVLQDRISKWLEELSDLYGELTPEQLQVIQQQTTDYYEGRLDHLDIVSKAQVQATFECFRQLGGRYVEKDFNKQQLRNVIHGKVPEHEEIVAPTKPTKKSKKNKRNKKDEDNSIAVQQTATPTITTYSQSDNLQLRTQSGEIVRGPQDEEISSRIIDMDPTVGTVPEIVLPYVEENKMAVNQTAETYANVVRKSLTEDRVVNPSDNSGERKDSNPTKTEAWNAFVNTKKGSILIQDLTNNENLLKETTHEHNEVLQKVSSLMVKPQGDLDQQDRRPSLIGIDEDEQIKNAITVSVEKEILHDLKVLLINRDDLLERIKSLRTQLQAQKRNIKIKNRNECSVRVLPYNQDDLLQCLKNLRMQIHTQKQIVEAGKNECDAAFQDFCTECYGVAFINDDSLVQANLESTTDDGRGLQIPQHELQGQNKEEIAKHFNELKRLAREQAKQFLRFYPKRLPWNPY